jgi:hypothetical protein
LTVFSANGKPLHTIGLGSEAVGVTAKGDFLLTQSREKLYTLKESGAVGHWEAYSSLFPVVGILPNENDSLLVAGIWRDLSPGILGFAKVSREGNIVWKTFLPNVFSSSWISPSQIMRKTPIARAADGSVRVIVDVQRFYWEPVKPTVFAFAID